MKKTAIGIDFGTSNSAVAAVGADGLAQAVPLEGGAFNLPTALFFNVEERRTHFGRDAIAQYLAGTDGRLLRSLKSLLGSALLQEKTEVQGTVLSYQQIIGRFLTELARRTEKHLGERPTRVVLGRPVHFVDDDAARDKQAEASLRQAATEAGFEEISFQFEPIAAAFDYERRVSRESLVLIVDIGGGTSDFTIVRVGPERVARPNRADDVLATTGVHIGGTDYDRRLSLDFVMPLLGLNHRGPQGREVPSGVFFDLATWHLIHRLYSPRQLRDAADLRTSYSDLNLHARLMAVLQEREGHRIASGVEQAKIHSSVTSEATQVDLDCAERGLVARLAADATAVSLDGLLRQVVASAHDCVKLAGLKHSQLDAVYLTGGSSALRPFQHLLREAFAPVPLVEGDLFGGVAAGLAYAAG